MLVGKTFCCVHLLLPPLLPHFHDPVKWPQSCHWVKCLLKRNWHRLLILGVGWYSRDSMQQSKFLILKFGSDLCLAIHCSIWETQEYLLIVTDSQETCFLSTKMETRHCTNESVHDVLSSVLTRSRNRQELGPLPRLFCDTYHKNVSRNELFVFEVLIFGNPKVAEHQVVIFSLKTLVLVMTFFQSIIP